MNIDELIQLIEAEYGPISGDKLLIRKYTESELDILYKTEKVEYQIHAILDYNYLGCIATLRHMRPHESWYRGNDLSDGNCTIHTWNNIVRDIEEYDEQLY